MLVFSISFKIEEGGVKTIQYKKHGVYSYISTMFVATVHNFSRVGEGQVLVSAQFSMLIVFFISYRGGLENILNVIIHSENLAIITGNNS